jgi:hypothetical protein
LKHHHCIPTGLGAKRSDTRHRSHCVYHALLMECGSAGLLVDMLGAVVSVTGDLGTESGMTQLQPLSFNGMFPHFAMPDTMDIDDGQLDACPVCTSNHYLHLNDSMYCAGGLHILGNISRDMLYGTVHYEEIHVLLNALTQFLSDKLTRNLYLGCCLTGAFEPLRTGFASFSCTLVGWRWEQVWICIQKVLELELTLRRTWDMKRKTSKHQVDAPPVENAGHIEEGVAKGVRAHLNNANAAVTSPYFWQYVRMLSLIGDMFQHMNHWFESCPCHGGLNLGARNSSGPRAEWHKRFRGYSVPDACPLKGRRAPELAAGSFDVLINEVSSMASASVMILATGGLQADGRRKILSDFELLRVSSVQMLKFKLAPWRVLPRALAGVAHWDEVVARRCAAECIRARRPLSALRMCLLAKNKTMVERFVFQNPV